MYMYMFPEFHGVFHFLKNNVSSFCFQSATMVPMGDRKNRIVMRGCAQPSGLPCISMALNRDVLKMIAGMDKYDSMAQKCCNSPFCNAGSAVNFVTYNASNFETEYNIHNDENGMSTDNTINTSPEKGQSRSANGRASSLFRESSITGMCSFSILTFILSLAIS